jgi:hypothetical protein
VGPACISGMHGAWLRAAGANPALGRREPMAPPDVAVVNLVASAVHQISLEMPKLLSLLGTRKPICLGAYAQ